MFRARTKKVTYFSSAKVRLLVGLSMGILALSVLFSSPLLAQRYRSLEEAAAIRAHFLVRSGESVQRTAAELLMDTRPSTSATEQVQSSRLQEETETSTVAVRADYRDAAHWIRLTGSGYNSNEYSSSIALGDDGTVYVVGWTWSTNFPTTTVIGTDGAPLPQRASPGCLRKNARDHGNGQRHDAAGACSLDKASQQ